MNGNMICISPEMFAEKSYDIHVDVFSAALILLALIIGTTTPMYMNMPIEYAMNQGVSLNKILYLMNIDSKHTFRKSLEEMLAHRSERLLSAEAYIVLLNA
ncbi:unnamed protein product [Rotaria sordida]|uniref:Uncharacterized protein n=1 Tax=Rotaria sordida TaxID=392033 RepID=A0A815SCI8_9BILA|nr:unnamed protein product [Rotaria sordida]